MHPEARPFPAPSDLSPDSSHAFSSSSANMSNLIGAVHEQFVSFSRHMPARVNRAAFWKEVAELFLHQLAELGNGLMDLVKGPHITYIDVRQHTSAESIQRYAKSLVARFEKLGRDRSTFLVSVSIPKLRGSRPVRAHLNVRDNRFRPSQRASKRLGC